MAVEPESAERSTPPEPTQPQLSADFFQELLGLPSCKVSGVCENCGRCEH